VSREGGELALSVAKELPIDHIGEPALEAAEGLLLGVAFGPLAEIVSATGGVAAGLARGHDVQGVVQLSIPRTGQSVSDDLPTGGFDGRHATVMKR
jgi:hypothetical protein